MSDDLSHWLLFEEYSIDEAALLFAGIEPYKVDKSVDKADEYQPPKAAKAKAFRQNLKRLTNIENPPIQPVRPFEKPGEGKIFETYFYYEYTTIKREDIIKWAQSRGFEFPEGCPVEPEKERVAVNTPLEQMLNPRHKFYSENLAIAVQTWCELAEEGEEEISKHPTPKQAAIEKIKAKLPSNHTKRRRDAIAQVVNWTENDRVVLDPPKGVTL